MTKEEKIETLIAEARKQAGKPYVYGAYAKEDTSEYPEGFDCSSFAQFIFRSAGMDLPRSSILQAASELGEEVSKNDLQAGDVIFFESTKGHYAHKLFPGRKIYIGHLAIYTGGGNIIHAADNPELNPILKGVVEHPLSVLPVPPYEIVMVKRFIK